MQPQHRNHLSFLDRALLNLLEERARLAREATGTACANLEDLLARATGDFPAARLREVLAAVESGCTEAAGRRKEGAR